MLVVALDDEGVGRLASVSAVGDAVNRLPKFMLAIVPVLLLWLLDVSRLIFNGEGLCCLILSSRSLSSSLTASPDILLVGVISFGRMSSSLSSSRPWNPLPDRKDPSDVVLCALKLKFGCEWLKELTAVLDLRGSGIENEVFLLGMMIGSSSDDDSSSSEHHRRRLPTDCVLARFRRARGLSRSTTSVVSTRARPFSSMVNFACVLVRGPAVSGMDVRLGSRWWLLFNGDNLPLDLLGCEKTGRPMPKPAPLDSGGCARGAGARAGKIVRLPGLLPLFSLRLLPSPGRPMGLIGELARTLSFFRGSISLSLAERRSSPRDGTFATDAPWIPDWEPWVVWRDDEPRDDPCAATASRETVSILADDGRLKSRPGSTPVLIIPKELSIAVAYVPVYMDWSAEDDEAANRACMGAWDTMTCSLPPLDTTRPPLTSTFSGIKWFGVEVSQFSEFMGLDGGCGSCRNKLLVLALLKSMSIPSKLVGSVSQKGGWLAKSPVVVPVSWKLNISPSWLVT